MPRQIKSLIKGQEDTPIALLMETTAREAPLRTMMMAADGSISREMLEALLVMINGKFLKELGAFVKAVRVNKN
jgi:hypothetical protein